MLRATLSLSAAFVAVGLGAVVAASSSAHNVTYSSSNSSSSANQASNFLSLQDPRFAIFQPSAAIPGDGRPPGCPPCPEPSCFNCQLPAYNCAQFGECSEYDGLCTCPTGFGGPDCLNPLCGSPVEGNSKRFAREGEDCECEPGWEGLNCNVCKHDSACDNMLLGGERLGENGTCYKGGYTITESFQECDVTNKKINDMLPGRKPQVTFSCDSRDETCNFQFWIGKVESFYCALQGCGQTLEQGPESNNTKYSCEKVQCSCVPERMLCGEKGSIDISDFLSEEIKGPGTMTCKTGKDGRRTCRFEEPAMNGLINDVFGDEAIFLSCDSGECVHYSQVPGYHAPRPKPRKVLWVAFSAASAIFVVVVASILLWILGRHYKHEDFGAVRLPEEEASKLMTDHVPAALHFSNLSYQVNDRIVLDGITGSVAPGKVMAIVGASGAGKTTFLDILARRDKRGSVSGQVLVNGRSVCDTDFRRVVGFVDQEDTLMSTLTVYETVLYSAMLRLPRDFSIEAKKLRTLETLQELGILGIKDSRIGDSGHRSISGGEKRRVSIACELVTSPSILFCDEPTSGLDAYNAYNVVESLVTLAREYRRTVIFTIHQPRSNIVALFDQLVLLAKGKTVYSGPFDQCVQYFDDIGHPCPPGFNLADHLIDMTMQATLGEDSRSRSRSNTALNGTTNSQIASGSSSTYRDEEARLGSATNGSGPGSASRPGSNDETELRTRPNSIADELGGPSPSNTLRHKTSRLAKGLKNAFSSGSSATVKPLPPRLAVLVEAYASSCIAANVRAEIDGFASPLSASGSRADTSFGAGAGTAPAQDGDIDLRTTTTTTAAGVNVGELPDVGSESKSLRGHKKASFWTQFTILSGRAFKNLYRNPMLMVAHYVMAIVLALFCGLLYHNVTNDISGFQNRLGLFFFILSLFGFSCLTSLGVFANERALFLRERANGYYSPITYFISKLLFDILPLRVIPPFILGGIVYFLVGLVPSVPEFWKFILTLVLFSLAASSAVLFISIAIADTGVANLVGSLTMLFNLLFAGLLINRDRIPFGLQKLQHVSFFHAAYEALIVNELRQLSLKEHKYGLEIEVPAASIISSFGFNSQAFWWPDIATLGILFGTFTTLSLLWLIAFVKERK